MDHPDSFGLYTVIIDALIAEKKQTVSKEAIKIAEKSINWLWNWIIEEIAFLFQDFYEFLLFK